MDEVIYNTGETFTQLRRKYNPDGSTLRKAQLRMLEILKFVVNICEENHLRYWLSSGTLLGAYRHQGFIPWDDDLDIEMPREDYLKFRRIMQNLESDDYVLHDYSTDSNYYYAYAKVRDLHSICYERVNTEPLWKYKGLWIDIFIMENYDVFWQKISFYTYSYGRRYLCHSHNILLKALAKIRFAFNYYFLFPLMRPLASALSSHKELNKTFGSEYPNPLNVIDIYPLTKIKFEGLFFNAPHHIKAVLTASFGADFSQLPPLETRGGHQMSVHFL